jgi:squalene-hopene/tetraprenyl-beta-curcumene cyclase
MLAEAGAGFSGARHEMVFPRWAGFHGDVERQSSDVFGRAVIAGALLDVAELQGGEGAARWAAIAAREAEHVAAARLGDRAGGWSYFPGLPELPPDLDSLAAATLLFARAAPHHLPLCDEPIRAALDGARADGSVKTWILDRANSSSQLRAMRRGIRRYWGDGAAVEVCARFLRALHRAAPQRCAAAVARGTRWVVSQQRPSGAWDATWYWGEVSGTALCLSLLREVEGEAGASDTLARAASRGIASLCGLQRDDGGWGVWESVPLDTAIALRELALDDAAAHRDRITRAVELLLAQQGTDGSWPATPWIKMDVGRAAGRVVRTLTHGSTTVTTTFCLRALVTARRRLNG